MVVKYKSAADDLSYISLEIQRNREVLSRDEQNVPEITPVSSAGIDQLNLFHENTRPHISQNTNKHYMIFGVKCSILPFQSLPSSSPMAYNFQIICKTFF